MISLEKLKEIGLCDELIEDVMQAEEYLDKFIDEFCERDLKKEADSLYSALLLHRFGINLLNDIVIVIDV